MTQSDGSTNGYEVKVTLTRLLSPFCHPVNLENYPSRFQTFSILDTPY